MGMQATSDKVICVTVYCLLLYLGNLTHSCQNAEV